MLWDVENFRPLCFTRCRDGFVKGQVLVKCNQALPDKGVERLLVLSTSRQLLDQLPHNGTWSYGSNPRHARISALILRPLLPSQALGQVIDASSSLLTHSRWLKTLPCSATGPQKAELKTLRNKAMGQATAYFDGIRSSDSMICIRFVKQY